MSEFTDEQLKIIHQDMIELDLKAPQSIQHQELMSKIQRMTTCKHRWRPANDLFECDFCDKCYRERKV